MKIIASGHGSARLFTLWAAFSLVIASCAPLLPDPGGEATASPTPGNEPAIESTATAESESTITLRVWLPPAFAPGDGGLASGLMQERLEAFEDSHPNINIDVRLKLESGEGGLQESLASAQAAAPLSLPDLVLLPSDLVSTSVESDLLYPLEGLLGGAQTDWFGFAQQMVSRDGEIYGLPLAGDALIMVHRLTALEQPPRTWQDVGRAPLALGFAAADPEALFSFHHLLALYEAVGVTDFTQLDSQSLMSLFNFYAEGRATGAFPFWLTQYESQEQSWQSFVDGAVPMVAAWSSRYLQSTNPNQAAALLPTENGEPFALARGWAWVITSANSDRIALSFELAEFLSDAEFMAQWSAAAGLLPARPSSLAAWSPDQRQALANQAAPAAHILPDPAMRSTAGAAISENVVALLKQEVTPPDALQAMIERLGIQ